MASRSKAAELEQALSTLTGRSFGRTEVRNATAQLGVDQDNEPVLRLVVALSAPEDPEGTWPFEDADAIRKEARRLVASVEDDEDPYAIVELRPDEDAAQAGSERSQAELADELDRADDPQ